MTPPGLSRFGTFSKAVRRVRARFGELFTEDKLQRVSCTTCGKWLVVAPEAPVIGDPAKRCTCGAIYCHQCYDSRLPGYFGEEMRSAAALFIPIAAVGYYLAAYHPTLKLTGIVFGASVLGGVFINQQFYLPMSRILRIAKQCRACGGRTFADWTSMAVVEGDELPAEESEADHGHVPAPRLVDEPGST
jgi:hypothetical protein